MKDEIKIHAVTTDDTDALLKIYDYYVKNTAITYEYETPPHDEFFGRIEQITRKYPYIAAEKDGKIIGYAYASQFHPRAAYSWDAEMTIYLDHTCRGLGVGAKLYDMLEAILAEQGFVNAIALITPPSEAADPSMYGSMHFHEKRGYRLMGMIENCGYKFNTWYNTVWMYKQLNAPQKNMKEVKTFDEVREKFGI